MKRSPTLQEFAELVATDPEGEWFSQFVQVVMQCVPGTTAVTLFARERAWPQDRAVPLATIDTPPVLSVSLLENLPRRVEDGLLLPLPSLDEQEAALWLRTTLDTESVLHKLRGWLAVAGMSLGRLRQESRLERQRTARDHFFSMVNHDLKAPLASIKAMADLIVRKIERGTLDPATEEGQADLLERLHFLSQRVKDLARLIDEIGDVSMIERDRLLLNQRKADLRGIVTSSIEGIVHQSGRQIDVENEDEPLEVLVDQNRFVQVFHILLKNAIDYSSPDSSIRVRLRRSDGNAHVEVEDKGRGISESQQGRLFREYGSVVQEMSSGLGVGLYIANALVVAHGGSLQLRSELDKGTVVRVTMPLVAKAEERRGAMKPVGTTENSVEARRQPTNGSGKQQARSPGR